MYSYSGPTAAFAYTHLLAGADRVKRVFVLGPSHHVYLKCDSVSFHVYAMHSMCTCLLARSSSGSINQSINQFIHPSTTHRACAVSGATVCETPVGDLQVR
jgi:predicted class III extradiol MEMO1 family dioxygenase